VVGGPARNLTGAFAIAGIPQATTGRLVVRMTGPLRADLDFSELHGGSTITVYDADMTKLAHQVAIAADFSWFAHLHPVLDRRGHFHNVLRVPRPGRYDVYADTDPHGLGKQVYRFTVDFGPPQTSLLPKPGSSYNNVDGYAVAVSPFRLRAGHETALAVAISRDGRPATDLRPYLGTTAHAVLIDVRTLSYVHVHPENAAGRMAAMPEGSMPMPETPMPANAPVAPQMRLHVRAPTSGTYVLWLQFRSSSGLHVARFVVACA